jgi:hypothetical protein
MSQKWPDQLKKDPVPCLLSWADPALAYFVRRDLLDEQTGPIEALWTLPGAQRLVRKQRPEGSWRYPGKSIDPWSGTHYNLLETYRSLRVLVEMYGFTRSHPALEKAAGFVFSHQTAEGDIRGILGNQYMPYYHGAILELLAKAGYAGDKRLEKGLEWLLAGQQADAGLSRPRLYRRRGKRASSGWVSPYRRSPQAILPPATGMGKLAAHSRYRQRRPAAGTAQKPFFQPDHYYDRKARPYWLKFQYPFWWTSLLTALDTLFWLGFSKEEEQIAKGLAWFLTNQQADGLWETGYGSGGRAEENRRWVGLAACRMLKRYLEDNTI